MLLNESERERDFYQRQQQRPRWKDERWIWDSDFCEYED